MPCYIRSVVSEPKLHPRTALLLLTALNLLNYVDRNVLFASLETFQQNNNAYVRAPLSRNRFTVGIEISLSGETERRRDYSNEDTQNVALTDRARRRPNATQ